MDIQQLEKAPNYRSYVVDQLSADRYWVVTAWSEDSKVSDNNKGDLTLTVYLKRWDGDVRMGTRRASDFERAFLATLIEIYDYA